MKMTLITYRHLSINFKKTFLMINFFINIYLYKTVNLYNFYIIILKKNYFII